MTKLSQTDAAEPRQSLVESSMPVCWFAGPQICSRRTKIEDPWAAVSINRDKHAKICRKENSSRETTDQVLHELEVMPVKVITEQDYKLKQQK
jgi:hypothetical protein